MEQVKISIPHDLKMNVVSRIEELNLNSLSEYFRLLANLDISVQRYQKLNTYINHLYNKINEIHNNMGIFATPIQEIPLIDYEYES